MWEMELKVIKPINEPENEFKTVDEFNLFYAKNKEAIDATTTHKLNKMYHIEGHRITKIKNVLMLKVWNGKKYYVPQSKARDEYIETEIQELRDQIGEVQEKLDTIEEVQDGLIGKETLQPIMKELQDLRKCYNSLIQYLKQSSPQ
jgi:uncharacterized protein (UPF0305 family)